MSAETEKAGEFNAIVRIAGTDIKGNKKLLKGLCAIRGVSDVFSNAVIKSAKISLDKKVGELSESEIKKIEQILKNPHEFSVPSFLFNRKLDPETMKDEHVTGSELKLQNDFDIRRLKRIRSYKGVRHNAGLKVRGQRLKRFRKGGAAVAKKKVKLK
ncbi:MAG: 30S ribosomal protein S13 [Candidatus Nanoarchaeia archaeon]|nr:30S ribosomal protein S13 [Candidatus Nanoarchaeia archaeon]MDD5054624.1 30S ribosomal protein S13 [Candidatus Nanoarchaeia archaeon]MDD5500037.1 30S ribosomal protein S13 [Candidatus Nanoarchaeia archaeon]